MKTQRKTVIVLITTICVLAMNGLFAQSVTYDCSAGGWTTVGTQVTIGPTTATFAGAADGTIPRFVHRNLPWTLGELAWYCDFEFTVNGGNGPAHTLVAFTEVGTPILNAGGDFTIAPMDYSNTNCIGVFITGPIGNADITTWSVYAAAKKRNLLFPYGYTLAAPPAWSSSAPIPVGNAGVTRYMRIQRLDDTRCKLTMFADVARTVVVGSSCFNITGGNYNLGNVQVGNRPEGSNMRILFGTVDNIKVCSLNPQLTGSSGLCSISPSLYKLQNGNASVTTDCGFPGATSFTWSAPAGSTLGNGVGGECYTSFGVGGNGSRNLITVGSSGIVSCTVNYGCASVTYTFSVTLNNPTATITTLTNYCFGSPIIVNGSGSTNETNYFWSAAPCNELGLLTGPWVNQPIQTGTAGAYDITSLLGLPPLAPCSLNYSIKLTTSNPLCGSVVSLFPSIIKIYKSPEMAVSMAAFLCEGECANLSVGGTCSYLTTYTWSPASGLDLTSGTNVVACPEVSTTYTVIGTNPGCPPGSASIPVTLSTLNVDAGPDHTMCCNDTYTMAPTVSGGTPSYSYEWIPETGLSCTDCPNPIVYLCTPVLSLPATVTYTLTVTDDAGCTNSDVVSITLVPCRLAGNQNNQSEEDASSEQISVFPNPASQVIQITTGSYTASNIEITDLAGRVVVSTKPQSTKVELNIADLPEGAYLIRIETDHGIETREIIISR